MSTQAPPLTPGALRRLTAPIVKVLADLDTMEHRWESFEPVLRELFRDAISVGIPREVLSYEPYVLPKLECIASPVESTARPVSPAVLMRYTRAITSVECERVRLATEMQTLKEVAIAMVNSAKLSGVPLELLYRIVKPESLIRHSESLRPYEYPALKGVEEPPEKRNFFREPS